MEKLLIKWFVKNEGDIENPKVRTAYGYLGSCFGLVSNLMLFVVKLLVGSMMNSIAVTADAFNNLSDMASSGVTLFGFRMSGKPADEEHPFGHGRAEYLSTLVVAAMILVVGFELAKASFEKILNPTTIEVSPVMILLLCGSVGVKFYQSRFNRRIGEKIHSSVLLATATDSMNDVIATSGVILSVVLGYFLPFSIDGYVGVLVALFILKAGYDIIKDTIDPLLGVPATKEFVDELVEEVMAFDGVVGTHDLIVHDYGPGRKLASIHAEMPDTFDFLTAHEISDAIERQVSKSMGIFLTVHIDPVCSDDAQTAQIRQMLHQHLNKLDSNLSFHDLRIVKGEKTINVIFDIVITGEYFELEKQHKLFDDILSALKRLDERYNLVLEFDVPYYLFQ